MQINIYRRLDALKIKAGISIKKISFIYGNQKIQTSDYYIYIGETQSSLFMYNKKDSTTMVFKTSNLDSLNIK